MPSLKIRFIDTKYSPDIPRAYCKLCLVIRESVTLYIVSIWP